MPSPLPKLDVLALQIGGAVLVLVAAAFHHYLHSSCLWAAVGISVHTLGDYFAVKYGGF